MLLHSSKKMIRLPSQKFVSWRSRLKQTSPIHPLPAVETKESSSFILEEIYPPIQVKDPDERQISIIIPYVEDVNPERMDCVNELFRSLERQTRKSEVIIVEDLHGKEKSNLQPSSVVSRHILLKDHLNRMFNKAWCANVGARAAAHEGIVIMDLDMSFEKDFIERVISGAIENTFFNCWSTYVCMPGRDNPKRRTHKFPLTLSSILGAFYTTKSFLFGKLGGLNESFFGYGGEDSDLYVRAKALLGEVAYLEYTLRHTYHHWHPAGSPNSLNTEKYREDMCSYVRKEPLKVTALLIAAEMGNQGGPNPLNIPEKGIDDGLLENSCYQV